MSEIFAVNDAHGKDILNRYKTPDRIPTSRFQANTISTEYLACLSERIMRWSVYPLPNLCPSGNCDSGAEPSCPVFELCSQLFPRR